MQYKILSIDRAAYYYKPEIDEDVLVILQANLEELRERPFYGYCKVWRSIKEQELESHSSRGAQDHGEGWAASHIRRGKEINSGQGPQEVSVSLERGSYKINIERDVIPMAGKNGHSFCGPGLIAARGSTWLRSAPE